MSVKPLTPLPKDIFAWPRRDRRAWLSAHPEATRAYLLEKIQRLTPSELAKLRASVSSVAEDDSYLPEDVT